MKKIFLSIVVTFLFTAISAQTYHPLQTTNLVENWSNAALISVNDNWTGYPSFRGFLGQDLTSSTGIDPQTVLIGASPTPNDLDVIANQTNPNTQTSGGVAEFDGIANPSIALQGSNTADAPFLVIYLNGSNVSSINVSYNLRDLDGSADNSIQPVALQYRIGSSGNFTNLPLGFVADASNGPNTATLVTPVNVILPAICDGQAQIEIRIITTNAASSDEWIGIDDILITSIPLGGDVTPPTISTLTPPDNATNIPTTTNLSILFSEPIAKGTGNIEIWDASGPTLIQTIPVTDLAVTVTGSTATIAISPLVINTNYYILIPTIGTFVDLATIPNPFAGITANTTWNFTTDGTAPTITTLTPVDNGTNISISTNLTAVFNENIIKGTGNIVIKRLDNNSTVQTIDVTNAAVTITGNNTVTIDINDLLFNTDYYVEIDAGAIKDVSNINFAGITGNSTWNFTTIPQPAAGIIGNNYSFTSCTTTFITEGWRQFSVTGAQTWACTTSGRTGADGMEMNAFVSSGNNPLNEDWLISPPFDLTSTTAPTLKFYSKGDFTPGHGLVVRVSTNYAPGTNPNTATWTNVLTFPTPSGSNTAWLLNDNIDLSTYNTSNVYVAWFYSNPSTANSSRWRIDDVTLYSNIVLPPCDEPSDQPTNLLLTPTATSVSGSFTAVFPAPSGYLVVRSTSATLSANPIDATTYTVGAPLGGGVVIANGAATTFTDNGLAPTTTYYYFVFAYNNENCIGGPNYAITINPAPTGNTNSTTTLALAPCIPPIAAPTTLNLSATNTTISGSFTASASANRYLVVISTSTPLGATPTDGTTYTAGSPFGTGTVVAYSASTTFNATGLTANTPYFIFVFAANGDCTGEPNYFTTSLDGTTTTTNGTGVPNGYYDAALGLTCQPLKTALKNIISTGTEVLSYTPGLWNLYQFSDIRRNDANNADIVWDTYSDNPTGADPYTFTFVTNQCGNYTTEGDCYNREHSTPQSWFNQVSPMVSDAHHIFPTDGKVNAMHSNYPYGEVQNLTVFPMGSGYNNPSLAGSKLGIGSNFGFTGTVFEPINEYKGDYARAFLYMAVRYEDEMINQNWPQYGRANEAILSTVDQPNAAIRRLQFYDDWYIKLLYKWHLQDPVSAKEINRNNVIFSQLITDGASTKKQGNRNPFVDHPEYVAAIWGPSCLTVLPVTITNFSVKKNNNTALVSWKINNELSIKKYEVERSTNGINFEKIGEVKSNGSTQYSFTDNTLPLAKTIYYRLKIVELSGKLNTTNVITIDGVVLVNALKISPNPANEKITIQLNNGINQKGALLTIFDFTGRLLVQKSLTNGQNTITLPVLNYANGTYFIKINTDTEVLKTNFIISR